MALLDHLSKPYTMDNPLEAIIRPTVLCRLPQNCGNKDRDFKVFLNGATYPRFSYGSYEEVEVLLALSKVLLITLFRHICIDPDLNEISCSILFFPYPCLLESLWRSLCLFFLSISLCDFRLTVYQSALCHSTYFIHSLLFCLSYNSISFSLTLS